MELQQKTPEPQTRDPGKLHPNSGERIPLKSHQGPRHSLDQGRKLQHELPIKKPPSVELNSEIALLKGECLPENGSLHPQMYPQDV